MRPRSGRIATRVLLPLLLLATGTVVLLLVVTDQVTSRVREDYDEFALTTATSHVATIFDLAASELVALQLTGSPVVVEAKKASVREAIQSFWSRSGIEGALVAGDGRILAGSRAPAVLRAAVAACRGEHATLRIDGEQLLCRSHSFPLWSWTAVTFTPHVPLATLRPELVYLPRVLLAGAVALSAAVLLLFWRFLSAPIHRMVTDLAEDREVGATGIVELDGIGSAVNTAVERLRLQTRQLADELAHRHRVEEALQEKEAHLRLLLDSTAEGIFGVDAQGVCTFCNPSALRHLGFGSEDEILGRPIHELSHHTRADGSRYPAEDCPILLVHGGREPVRVSDDVFWRADGTKFPVEYWACPVLDRGVVTGSVVGFVDISDRQVLEEQLRQSQKMEAVGRLAGGIAHDFNNMLTAIVGFAAMAREEAVPGSTLHGYADQVLVAAAKATDLTRQILAFSRKQVLSPAPIDLNGVVRDMTRILGRVLGEDVEVGYDLAPGELVTLADRAQIEQVLMNLATNARDAMPRGGHLRVATRAVTCDAKAVALHGLEAPGRYALVTVSDDGVGMDDATCRRVFEPFFTTKELGKGTGLGLSIVYGIVRQHRGQIEVASGPGRGTTFRIHLRLTEAAAQSADAEPTSEPRKGTEMVLVAEDNGEVRALVCSVLRGAGYRVLVARDGLEALRLHEAHADEVELCLVDAVMPHLGGLAVLEEIRARRPGVRALLMSGYAPELAGTVAADLLAKPFTPRELLLRVREALDAPLPHPGPARA